MLISNIYVDNDAQSFETTREKNYSITAPGAHILLSFDDAWLLETTIINNHSVTAPTPLVFWLVTVHSPFEKPQEQIMVSLH